MQDKNTASQKQSVPVVAETQVSQMDDTQKEHMSAYSPAPETSYAHQQPNLVCVMLQCQRLFCIILSAYYVNLYYFSHLLHILGISWEKHWLSSHTWVLPVIRETGTSNRCSTPWQPTSTCAIRGWADCSNPSSTKCSSILQLCK